MFPQDIFQYITAEESRFDTDKISIGTNWQWNMKEFVQMVFHLKHGVFFSGENDWMRAFKNVMDVTLGNAKVLEDIELKDVVFFSESKNGRVASFFFKKYHDEVYAKKYDLDELFDEIAESDGAYGGVIVDTTSMDRPTVTPLTKVAFCDQTDILGGPIAIKMYLSPSKLKKMEKNGWFNVKNGADVIKFGASAGVLSEEESVGAPQYTQEEMNAIVSEAKMWGRKTAAHAHGTEAIKMAVLQYRTNTTHTPPA